MSAWLPVLYAAADPTGGWGDIVATYGPFAPVAALLLLLLQLLWKDNKEKDAEIRRLMEKAMDEVIPLVIEGSGIMKDSVSALGGLKESEYDMRRLGEEIAVLREEIAVLRRELGIQKRATRKT
jgi:hypothetical protein